MLDLNSPEAHKLIDVCFKIEALRLSVDKLTKLSGKELDDFYSQTKYHLGLIALEADRVLPDKKREEANNIIQLLYKPMTGQVVATEKDFDRIRDLFIKLEESSFSCWCI